MKVGNVMTSLTAENVLASMKAGAWPRYWELSTHLWWVSKTLSGASDKDCMGPLTSLVTETSGRWLGARCLIVSRTCGGRRWDEKCELIGWLLTQQIDFILVIIKRLFSVQCIDPIGATPMAMSFMFLSYSYVTVMLQFSPSTNSYLE